MNIWPMRHHFHTEPGGKEENEDCLLMRPHPQDNSVWIACIADGQGGRSNGGVAAQTACASYYEKASRLFSRDLFDPKTQQDLFHQVDQAVALTEGFTTFIAVIFDPSCLIGGSSGDSKVYATTGQSSMEELTIQQRKNPPVGSGEAVFEIFTRPLFPKLRLLMVTDGVWKYAGYENVKNALEADAFSEVATVLRAATLTRCGTTLPDDFSLIGIEL